MALIKSLEVNNTGVFASYWRVIVVNVDYENQNAHVVIAGYADATARELQKKPLDQRAIDFWRDNFPFQIEPLSAPGVNSVQVAYTQVKALIPEFADAEDAL